MEKLIILDLFCGAGGFSYGMHKNQHFSTAVACDFNEAATKTFKLNMPQTQVITGDITDDNIKREIIQKSRNAGVNMIIGGPPCQGFAMKGKKLGLKDPRNFLFLEYLNIVEELNPEIFVIENVKRLLTTDQGWFKNEILKYIKNLGYECTYGVLNALDFEVPQSRERAFFICSKNKEIGFPESKNKKTTVKDAISDLAYLNSGEGKFEQEYKLPDTTKYQKLMRHNSDKLYNHQATNHSNIVLEKLSLIPPEKGKEYLPKHLHGNQQYDTTWCRLVWDSYSPTIDTRFDTPSNGTNSHPELNRSITPREAARLQSFDDKFIFYGKKGEICKQIGNAVPPFLSKVIADHIWNQLNSK